MPKILQGLHEIAPDYDALICDVWGVLHNGVRAHPAAVEALRRFRAERGPVILLSNAPRPAEDVRRQFQNFGVPEDCYDAIMTSGAATREELAERSRDQTLKLLHIGPPRDNGLIEGLNLVCVEDDQADLVLCSGLYDDHHESPEDYTPLLERLAARNLTMLCANPDIVVQVGDKILYCAGALARAYEALRGPVVYFGKPHRPVYLRALAAATALAGRPIQRPLAVGDGLVTDIKGANAMGYDALFIADGVHGEDVRELTPAHLQALFAADGVRAKAAMRTLVW